MDNLIHPTNDQISGTWVSARPSEQTKPRQSIPSSLTDKIDGLSKENKYKEFTKIKAKITKLKMSEYVLKKICYIFKNIFPLGKIRKTLANLQQKRQFYQQYESRLLKDLFVKLKINDISVGKEIGKGFFKTACLIKDEQGKIQSVFNNSKKENPTCISEKRLNERMYVMARRTEDIVPTIAGHRDKQEFLKSEIEPVKVIRERLSKIDPKKKENIVLPRVFTYRGDTVLVSEYWNKGGLDKYEPSSPQAALKASIDVATGITVLHEKDIIHRDIAARNILKKVETIDGEEQKMHALTDFGRTKFLTKDQNEIKCKDEKNPIRWMAPEEMSGISSKKTDVYAFGMTMLELHLGRKEWDECIRREETMDYAIGIMDSVIHKESGIPKFLYDKLEKSTKFQDLNKELKKIIFDCLKWNPMERLEMHEIKSELELHSQFPHSLHIEA